jgi:hypothetical protein
VKYFFRIVLVGQKKSLIFLIRFHAAVYSFAFPSVTKLSIQNSSGEITIIEFYGQGTRATFFFAWLKMGAIFASR